MIFKKDHSAQMNNIDKHATQSHFPNLKINIQVSAVLVIVVSTINN